MLLLKHVIEGSLAFVELELQFVYVRGLCRVRGLRELCFDERDERRASRSGRRRRRRIVISAAVTVVTAPAASRGEECDQHHILAIEVHGGTPCLLHRPWTGRAQVR